jgi:hypothetical protein
MPSQPTPRVSIADVERVVRRDFAADSVTEALAILGSYGAERWHGESDRVRLAALKLASGNLELLRRQIEVVKCDYRDVLVVAEYPNHWKCQWLSKSAGFWLSSRIWILLENG